jgi:hypothetical protein
MQIASFEGELPDFDEDQFMRPPWAKYPNLPAGSMGWRMGVGEVYLERYGVWFSRQARSNRLAVRAKYPAPAEWVQFWSSHFG